jgi:nitrite reductase (NO-forming)
MSSMRFTLFTVLAAALAACSADKYDAAKMDLKPAPAALSTERHKGPFASGGALSLGAELKALDSSSVKTVQLDTSHRIIEIAPGV